MTTVVVPAKSFQRAKSRLQDALDGPARAALARSLFERVLDAVAGCDGVTSVVVVTDGDEVAALAHDRGLRCVRDPGEPPLRLAVDLGLAPACADPSDSALVLMADLPWLCSSDVAGLLAALEHADVVLGPDAQKLGTNALALGPGVRMPTAFGRADSFPEHVARATALDLRVHVHESPGVAFDVDTPADLRAMSALRDRRCERSESAGRV
jgi:2-phospho-L-lactate guanylyltransferase